MSIYLSSLQLFVFFVALEVDSLRLILVLLCAFVVTQCSFTLYALSSSLICSLQFALTVIRLTFFSTSSLLVFYIRFELSLFPVSLLILIFGYQPEKINSTLFLLVYTIVGSLPLLYFVSISPYSLGLCFYHLGSYLSLLLLLPFIIKRPLYLLHS